MNIEDWRAEIDSVDDELLSLINKRARLAVEVVILKRAAGIPITDPEREREVLTHMAGGATNKEIAELLFLSPHTVKEHTSALYRKLGVRNRAEAVQRAERLGLTA